MKYLYKILRIFFCPHKWIFKHSKKVANDEGEYWTEQVCQCRYCGKFRSFHA